MYVEVGLAGRWMGLLGKPEFRDVAVKPTVSVFIPVYEGSDLLEPLLEELTGDNCESVEIFVVIDKPNEESLRIVERFRGRVHFLLNSERRGKVEALSSAVKLSKGELLVFLDADVVVGDGADFFRFVREALAEADIVDLKKKILPDSFISRMVNYEYVGSNFASYLFSRLVGRCIGIGGTAFAIKRESFEEVGGFSKVVSEDLDLAFKTLLKNKRFKYEGRVEIYTRAPSTWKGWLKQRKRWGIGTGLWIKENWKKLVRHIAKYPHVAFPCAVMIFPTVAPLLLGYMCFPLSELQFQKLVPAVLAAQLNIQVPEVVSSSLLSAIFMGLTNFLFGFFAFSTIFYAISKKFGFRFNIAEFLIYYFVYQPIATMVLFVGILRAFIFQNHELDWKV
ncbi:MAG: glycosyltransferase family 2 protein [Candidatus Bathyarchaeia archaeon]